MHPVYVCNACIVREPPRVVRCVSGQLLTSSPRLPFLCLSAALCLRGPSSLLPCPFSLQKFNSLQADRVLLDAPCSGLGVLSKVC